MKKQYIVTFWPIKIADKYSFIFKSLVFCKALNHKQKIINPIGITDNDLKKYKNFLFSAHFFGVKKIKIYKEPNTNSSRNIL